MKPIYEKSIKDINNSNLANNFNELAGGNNKKCNILENGCQNYINEILPENGISMEEYLNVKLQTIDRTKFPIVLSPETATFDDVAIHGILRQRLGPSTVAKNIRYARFMENHNVPVDFRKPTYENFMRHMDYREQFDFKNGKGYSALAHEWRAMQMFLKAYGMKLADWSYRPPSFQYIEPRLYHYPSKSIRSYMRPFQMTNTKMRS